MERESRRRRRSRRKPGIQPVQKIEQKESRKKSSPLFFFLGIFFTFLAFCVGVGYGWYRWGRETGSTVDLSKIQTPDWIEQNFIRENVYSRPATSRYKINDIVVHYVANPGKTAAQNRSYFDGLADQKPEGAESASAHFIIGLEGEIIQCIPIREFAYTSNYRNIDTVSIECCHPDETGEFTDATYQSLVRLTAWLCDELNISRKQVIRHYDVSEKICPKYFVDHQDAWETFKQDVLSWEEP